MSAIDGMIIILGPMLLGGIGCGLFLIFLAKHANGEFDNDGR